MPTLSVEKFLGLTDLPLYNREPGWCKDLQNMRVRPGGYLEQRAGFDAIKPSGGTAADPISAGIFTGGHEHTMADGFIYTHDGTNFSGSFAQRAYFTLWASGADGVVEGDSIYIGSTVGKFSRVVFYVGQALVWGGTAGTFSYLYPTAADFSTTAAFTLTTTPTFTSTGEQTLEVQEPGSAWIPAVRNGIYAYWLQIKMATDGDTGVATACTQGGTTNVLPSQKVYSDWPGARQIYVASANATGGAGNGTLKYYGQTSATLASWNSVSTSLFSGNYPRVRFASYRNLLYFVNGKEQKRWDGHTLWDIGFTKPDLTTTAATAVVGAGTGLGNGVWLYAMTYGYGPNGEWGESSSSAVGTAATTVSGANDGVRLEWAFNTTPGADVDVIYLYRTQNLTSAQASGQAAFPYYRFKTMYRNAAGTLPSGTGASGPHTDETLALPFPPVDLDIATRTPPSRCKFIGVHKNRLFLGSNNQYPGRVWWSQPFQAEAFNTDEDFSDFTRSTGGILTGMIEFGDQMVVFTEDKMFGVSNVDQDQPAIYEIATVGCIASDSIKAGNGILMWVGRDGVYRWTGEGPPENVSSSDIYALQRLTRETHGGARAAIHNQMYDLHFLTSANAEAAVPRRRYDMVTGTWSTVALGATKLWSPLASVTAPLGHADAGTLHPLYGASATGGSDYAIYLGEYTNQDGGSNFVCSAEVLVGPRRDEKLTARYIAANYFVGSPSTSFGSTVLDFGGNTATLGYKPVAATADLDGSDDYSRTQVNATNRSVGSGDICMRFYGTTQAVTLTVPARLLALHMEASLKVGGQN